MKKGFRFTSLVLIYSSILLLLIFSAFAGSRAVTTVNEATPVYKRQCVVIDAGHGGVDGGATSCTGVLESTINLEIALRLNDLMHLLGIDTVMIRTSDVSIYTTGNTIAAKKVSDLKERVKIVNDTENALLISIHQNHYSDSRYSGAQVFYSPTTSSDILAKNLQTSLVSYLNPGSKRQAKKADGIYLMQNVNCIGVLIECGFLSNPGEESNLRDADYQKKLCSIIASTVSLYLQNTSVA